MGDEVDFLLADKRETSLSHIDTIIFGVCVTMHAQIT